MVPEESFRRLEPDKLTVTIERLNQRIAASFPERGLSRVSADLVKMARAASVRVERLQRPNWFLRVLPFLLTALVILLVWIVVTGLTFFDGIVSAPLKKDLSDILEAFRQLFKHAAIPATVLLPGPLLLSIYAFVWTLERRWNQSRILRYLHEVRSIIHVIDMHQLTKDPHIGASDGASEALAGDRLVLYLDYCSELLSLSAKVAALYAESSRDPLVISTVSDLGQITANLSNKVWQKINIVERKMAAVPVR